jgi:hypothetical protein
MRYIGRSTREFFHCADSLITHYKAEGYNVTVVLVSTGVELQMRAKKRFGDMLLLPNGDPKEAEVVHDRPGVRSREEQVRLDRLGIMESARDYYIMSLTDIQILSPKSGFGVVGAMSGLKRKHIMYHLALEGENRECSHQLDGDELSVFAEEWSGL